MADDAADRTSRSSAPPEQRRAEHAFLLAAARTELPSGVSEHVASLGARDLDWQWVLETAAAHGVVPLFYRHVRSGAIGGAPPWFRRGVEGYYHASLRNSLLYVTELARATERIGAAGFPVLSFKGPLLAQTVYGDLGARMFTDLDLLVRRQDFEGVRGVLEQMGYRPYRASDAEAVRRHLDTQMGYEFVRGDVAVEVHWQFLNQVHAFRLPEEAVWGLAEAVEVGGKQVRTLSREALLVVLCAHGGKHVWDRLLLICDVAELLRCYASELDWRRVRALARRARAERMLRVGLLLAERLLDAPLPDDVARDAAADTQAVRLARHVQDHLFVEEADAQRARRHARFHLLMRERMRDRLPYLLHLVRLAFQPSESDRRVVEVRPRLAYVYYLVRPLRLAWRGLRRVAERATARRSRHE